MPDRSLPPHDTRSVGHVLTRFGKEVAFSVAASLALASMNWWLPALSNAVAGPADQVPAVQGLDTSTVILREPAPQATLQEQSVHALPRTHSRPKVAVATSSGTDAGAWVEPTASRWSDQLSESSATVEAPTFADLAGPSWPTGSHDNELRGGTGFDTFGSHDVFGRRPLGADLEAASGHHREQPVTFDPERRADTIPGDHGSADGRASGGHGPRSR